MQNGHGQVQSPFHNQAQEGVASSSSSSTEETGVENAAAILSVTSKTVSPRLHACFQLAALAWRATLGLCGSFQTFLLLAAAQS